MNEPVPLQQVLYDDPDDVLWTEDGTACLKDGQFRDQEFVSTPVKEPPQGPVPMVKSLVWPVEKFLMKPVLVESSPVK